MSLPAAMSIFAPRHAAALGRREIGKWSVKLYWMSAGEDAPEERFVDRAVALAGEALEDAPGHRAGFLIVHRGEAATWAILWWWSDTDILRRRIWQLPEDGDREVSADHYVACVWELSIVDWERKAWINHVLRHPRRPRGVDGYLDATYPSLYC